MEHEARQWQLRSGAIETRMTNAIANTVIEEVADLNDSNFLWTFLAF